MPFFEGLPRNESSPAQHCSAYMAKACAVNKTTGKPDLYGQCLMLEFTRVNHSNLWYV